MSEYTVSESVEANCLQKDQSGKKNLQQQNLNKDDDSFDQAADAPNTDTKKNSEITEKIDKKSSSLKKIGNQAYKEDALIEENLQYPGSMKQTKEVQQKNSQDPEVKVFIKQAPEKIEEKQIKKKPFKSKLNPKFPKKFQEPPFNDPEFQQKQRPMQNFDEKPIGKSTFNISEFADENGPPKEETNYTLEQKLKSKAVKLRIQGLQELLNFLEKNPDSPECHDIEIIKFLKESNPACLEKALLCFQKMVFLDKPWGQQQVKCVVQNGFINGKHASKKLAVEICDMLYEKNPDSVQISLIVGLKGKTPKNLAGYITIINELLKIYGIKRMKFLKPYLSEVVVILNREKLVAVKTEGINLIKQAYKWLTKEVVDPLTKDLKEGFKKQLDTFWEGYDKTQQMNAPKQIAIEETMINKKLDAYELSDAVDIFKKHNLKWSQNVIKQEKWSDKVDFLKEFVNSASVPKIANTQFRHITQMMKRLINHSNMNVVLWDLKAISALAKGLRKPLAGFVKTIFPSIISKFRDKKTLMIEETFNTLNNLTYCISIEDVHEDISDGLQDKNPNMKVNLINWIGKFVEKKIQENKELTEKAHDTIQGLFPIFDKLASDGVLNVRQCMMMNLQKMKMLLGENFFAGMGLKKTIKSKVNKLEQTTNLKASRKSSIDGQAKAETPVKKRKVSVQRQNSVKKMEKKESVEEKKIKKQVIKPKIEVNDEYEAIAKNLNHTDWQKRRDSAQALIQMFEQSQQVRIPPMSFIQLIKTLKTRISDPNKHIIKLFVRLSGYVFNALPQKDYKTHIKNFICSLLDGLSDKTEANRKQIGLTLQRLSQRFGKQNLLALFGPYLDSDKDSRFEVAHIILDNQQHLEQTDMKSYPKGIIRLMIDKNKKARAIGQQLFEMTFEKIGIETFRTAAKAQPPAIVKDLNEIFKKYDFKSQSVSEISKSVLSPPHAKPPKSVKKNSFKSSSKEQERSKSRGKVNQKAITQKKSQKSSVTTNFGKSAPMSEKNSSSYESIKGNQIFPDFKVLRAQRVNRVERSEHFSSIADRFSNNFEVDFIASLKRSLKQDLTTKMLSFDYRRVLEAVLELIALSKDAENHNYFKQIYDLIAEWALFRLWGGNPPLHQIIDILPGLLSILQKKKQQIFNHQVDLLIGVLREYLISLSMINKTPSKSLFQLIKYMTSITSPQKILKKILSEFSVDLQSLHQYLPESITVFYHHMLNQIIKKSLIEYIRQEDCLEEVSKIKELKKDKEFVQLLFEMFSENVLTCFGFQKIKTKNTKNLDQNISSKKLKKNNSSDSLGDGYLISKNKNTTQIDSLQASLKAEQHSIKNKFSKKRIHSFDIETRDYPAPHPASPLGKYLLKLLPPNESCQNFFTNLMNEKGEKISQELQNFAKIIFATILKSLITIFESRDEYSPDKILNQIALFENVVKCSCIFSHIDNTLLYTCVDFILYRLIEEDENKTRIHQELEEKGYEGLGDKFIKNINSIMLRILENGSAQKIINILFHILNREINSEYPSKKTNHLIVKIIKRIAKSYCQQVQMLRSEEFLTLFNGFLNIIQLPAMLQNLEIEQKASDEMQAAKVGKFILQELRKVYGGELWIMHHNAAISYKFDKDYIGSFLSAQHIPYPEKLMQLTEEDRELQPVIQMLHKNKTFEDGIFQLKQFMSHHQSFKPIEYLTSRDYEQKFIVKVMNAIEGRKDQNRSSDRKSDQSAESSIQEKIKRLKMRFEQIKPHRQNQSTHVQQEDNRSKQIKRKIDQMKNKIQPWINK